MVINHVYGGNSKGHIPNAEVANATGRVRIRILQIFVVVSQESRRVKQREAAEVQGTCFTIETGLRHHCLYMMTLNNSLGQTYPNWIVTTPCWAVIAKPSVCLLSISPWPNKVLTTPVVNAPTHVTGSWPALNYQLGDS